MMNTLQPQAVLDRLRAYPPLVDLLARLRTGSSPLDLAEAEGPFAAVVAAVLAARLGAEAAGSAKGCLLVVAPSDQDAEALAGDLELLGARAETLPWWRTAAYRPAGARAHAFGERAACLARLVLGEARVVVASQRAFVTPLPPRAAFAPLVFGLEEGGTIDPTEVGERLASYGYLRVPRVSLPGEFALRGEVLDLFMTGDAEALRIVFEFDTIERISTFDPTLQSGTGRLARVALRPMKELVWDAERVAALAAAIPSLPGVKGREGPLLEELAESGEAKGEELWYPLAFDRPGSILDYLPEGSVIMLVDHERLHAQEEAARKEYAGLYRRALQDAPVPPPERCIL
jgi:transcription-repair coupling factor (superfamily II helicase)